MHFLRATLSIRNAPFLLMSKTVLPHDMQYILKIGLHTVLTSSDVQVSHPCVSVSKIFMMGPNANHQGAGKS